MLITTKHVETKIKQLEDEGYIWKPLGGNANNEGQIQMLTDPDAGLAERITNSIDAILEKYFNIWNLNSKSPIELAKEIKSKLPKEEFENLVSITLYDSLNTNLDKSISIDITDKGIGVEGNQFENTILKLGGDNKISKKYLMGAYGQGGSTSIKFNEYTVICSKTKEDNETMTIIRYNLGNEQSKNGSYEYICQDINGKSHFSKTNLLKHIGTKVINIAMYYKKINTINQSANSLYSSLTNKLFYPPIPFQIFDKRQKYINNKEIIDGARRKLDSFIKDKKYYDVFIIKTKQGSKVYFRWWVVMPKKSNTQNKGAEIYLKDSRMPFNFTMNGQTHGYFSGTLLTEVELSFLKKRFICEIDLSNISKQEKRSILSSSRENISQNSEFWNELKSKIIKYLFNSSKLQKINKEIREMMASLIPNDKTFNKNLSKILKNFVSLFAKGRVKSIREIAIKEQVESDNLKNNEIELKMFPSYLHFLVKDPHEFSGDKLKIRYRTDGIKDVIQPNIILEYPSNKIKFISKTQQGGNGFLLFDTSKMKIHDMVLININILNDVFIDNIWIKKIDPIAKKEKPGYPKTQIIFITKEKDGDYFRLDFNKEKPCVAEYSSITNILKIYINMATYSFIGHYSKQENIQNKFKEHYSTGLSLYIISQIKKDKYVNSDLDENYNYNPIAKNLIWGFDKLEKLK